MYAFLGTMKFSCFFHWLPPPRNVKTLLLNTWAKSMISDSLICRVMLTSCQKNVRLLDNLLVTSTVIVAFSRVFVNARRAWLEYLGCETSLFKRMSTSRISNVLANRTNRKDWENKISIQLKWKITWKMQRTFQKEKKQLIMKHSTN